MYVYMYILKIEEKNYTFIPTSLFRGNSLFKTRNTDRSCDFTFILCLYVSPFKNITEFSLSEPSIVGEVGQTGAAALV